MLVRLAFASLAVVAVPIAVFGAEPAPTRGSDYATKKVCEANVPTGSRLGGVRACRTKAERDQMRAEARQVVERVQALKPVMCGPGTATKVC